MTISNASTAVAIAALRLSERPAIGIFTSRSHSCFVVGGQALLLVSDEQEAGLAILGSKIVIRRFQAGADQLAFARSQPGDEFGPACRCNGLREKGPHRCSHGLDGKRIGAIVEQDQTTGTNCVAGPEDGADIAGVAQRLSDDPQRRIRAVDPVE